MGECNYYGKAKFKNNDAAIEGLKRIKEFFEEGVRAHEWWQDHREVKYKDIFWQEFEKKFPIVTDYLKTQPKVWGKDHNNGLAGLLSFTTESIEREDGCRIVQFYGEVWHCADWDPIVAYLKYKFGATDVGWVN